MTLLNSAPDIAAEISSRLAKITTANGFPCDIGSRVFRGKLKVEDADVPCAVLVEGTDTAQGTPGRIPKAEIAQRYALGGYDRCDPNNPNDKAHDIIRSIKRVIFDGDATFGNRVKKVEYQGRDIGPRVDGVAIVFALIEIDVYYVEDLTNP